MYKWLGATAIVAGLSWFAAPAGAATVINSGDVIGGWQISFPEGIALFYDGTNREGDTIVLEKVANFVDDGSDGVIEGLQIVFSQQSEDAVPFIEISDENVTNNTGIAWKAFQFSLAAADFVGGDPEFTESFTSISPFTNTDFGSALIEINGGEVGIGQTVFWGVNGGRLLIAANLSQEGNRLFSFKEQPIPIPLPAAAWMGLVGLAGAGWLSKRQTKLA